MDSNIPRPAVFDEYKGLVVETNRLLVLGEYANYRDVWAREINGLNGPLYLPCYAAPYAGQLGPSPNRGSVSADPFSVFGIEHGCGLAIVRVSGIGESFDERPYGFFIGRGRLRIGCCRESGRPSDRRQKGSPFHKMILIEIRANRLRYYRNSGEREGLDAERPLSRPSGRAEAPRASGGSWMERFSYGTRKLAGGCAHVEFGAF